MRKIYLLILSVLSVFALNAQIFVSEDFNNAILPSGWAAVSFSTSSTRACEGFSLRGAFTTMNGFGEIETDTYTSNGTDLTVQYQYKVIDRTVGGNPGAAAGWGTFKAEYTTDGGANWTQFHIIDDSNYVENSDCNDVSVTIAGTDLPDGSNVQIRFQFIYANSATDNFDLHFDNFSAVQVGDSEPDCSTVTFPTNGAVDVSINPTFTWDMAAGIPTGYKVSLGTTPGGIDILDNVDVGNVTSYDAPSLNQETDYYLTVTPYNSLGDAMDCDEIMFTTELPEGLVNCGGTGVSDTYCYVANDFQSWTYTSSDGSPLKLEITAGNVEQGWDELRIYDGSDNTATLLYSSDDISGTPVAGAIVYSSGTNIYIELESDGSVQCSGSSSFSALEWTVSCASCLPPEVTFDTTLDCDNTQFFVDVNITDLGTGSNYTISDNQGNTATTTTTGVTQIGPYALGTVVDVNVVNADDSSCSVDGTGFTESEFNCPVIIDCDTPYDGNFCYDNNNEIYLSFQSADGSPLRVTFNSGTVEEDWDEFFVYDGLDNTGAELTPPQNYYGNGGDLTGLTFDSTGDAVTLFVQSDGIFGCADGDQTQWDFTVTCATCTQPEVEYTVVPDCENSEFSIEANVTSLGSGTNFTLSDDQSNSIVVTSTGVTTIGPYALDTSVDVSFTNDDDTSCFVNGTGLTYATVDCPIIVDCATGPITETFCYDSNNDIVLRYQSSDGTPLRVIFNSGNVEDGWDELYIYDGLGTTGTLLNPGEEYGPDGDGELAGIIYDSTSDGLTIWVDSDNIISCASGAQEEWNYTILCATCDLPALEYNTVLDCDNSQFSIEVNITDMGSATTYNISDSAGNTATATAAGVTTIGPYALGDLVDVTVANADDANCTLVEQDVTVAIYECPILVDCADPVEITYCYTNNDDTTFEFVAADGATNLSIYFNEGDMSTFGDALIITDSNGSELFNGANGGDFTDLQINTNDTSFIISFDTNGFTSCESSTFIDPPLNFAVYCDNCDDPETSIFADFDCDTSSFSANITVNDLGGATALEVSDDQGTTPITITDSTPVNFGNYPFGTTANISIVNVNNEFCSSEATLFMAGCPPTNDDCPDAESITVGEAFEDDPHTATNQFASNYVTPTYPSCAAYFGGDVWYTFVAPDSGGVIIETGAADGSDVVDTGFAIYSGTCGNLEELACQDDGAGLGFGYVEATGLTPGQTYYLRTWVFQNDPVGEYQISVYNDGTLGLFDTEIDIDQVALYPNPVKDVLNIKGMEVDKVALYDLGGSRIKAIVDNNQVNVSHLTSGTYIIVLLDKDNNKSVKKFIKK